MKPRVRVAVTSDYNAGNPGHQAADEALQHSATALGLDLAIDWLPTARTASDAGVALLESYHGVFSAGGAFADKLGALAAIRFAREQGWPFFGT